MLRLVTAALSVLSLNLVFLNADQRPTFQGGTRTVPLYATVLDRDGRLATNLTREDFEVFDNGRLQELTVFENDLQPITVVIMLDRSGSMVENFGLVRDAAEQFVSHLHETDRARVGSFSNRVQIDPPAFTSDRNELVRILHHNLQEPGMTPLWSATSAAMTALAREEGRRVVLVFTDGYNTPDWRPTNVTFRQVRDRSQAEGVMVYAIGLADSCGSQAGTPPSSSSSSPARPSAQRRPGGRGPIGLPPIGRDPSGPIPRGPRGPLGTPPFTPPPGDPTGGAAVARIRPCVATKPDPDLKELAAVSGGGYFELTDTADLGATFARVADELHHQYLLAFAPTELDGKLHALDVKLGRRDLTARARQSYVALDDAAASAQPR